MRGLVAVLLLGASLPVWAGAIDEARRALQTNNPALAIVALDSDPENSARHELLRAYAYMRLRMYPETLAAVDSARAMGARQPQLDLLEGDVAATAIDPRDIDHLDPAQPLGYVEQCLPISFEVVLQFLDHELVEGVVGLDAAVGE